MTTATAEMKTTTVIAEDAPIGVLLWPVRSAEYAPNFTLASVTRTRNTVIWTYEDGTVREFLPGERVACEFEREIFQRGDVVELQDRDRDPSRYAKATVISTHWRNDEFGYMVRADNDSIFWVREYGVLAPRNEVTSEALKAVAELRLFAIRKDDHEVSVRLDLIEATLKGKPVQ